MSDIDINKENYDINKVNAELEKIRETAVNKIWQIMKENVKIKTHQNIIKQKLIIMFLKGILSKICSIHELIAKLKIVEPLNKKRYQQTIHRIFYFRQRLRN